MPNEIDEATIDQDIELLKRKLAIVDGMLETFARFEEEEREAKPLWLRVWEVDAARQLANWGYYDPPIYEDEIKAYARRWNISERQAQLELRRRRAYDF